MTDRTVYVGHARSFDFQRELYAPLQALDLHGVHLLLPHATDGFVDTRALFEGGGCDLFIAEVSHAATGLGMELAYASVFGVPTVCVHHADVPVSGSIRSLNAPVLAYASLPELSQLAQDLIHRAVLRPDGPASSSVPIPRRPRWR